jgi:hypothetical protein
MTKDPTRVTNRSGKVLTDADFERLADEAESTTYDVEAILARRQVGRPPLGDKPSRVLQVRLDDDTNNKLVEHAATNNTTPSSVARDAIRAWLNAS